MRDLHRHAEDAAALLRQLQAVPATVLGASVGGIIALDLAVNHPEQVSSLVLCEPPLHLSRHPDLSVLKVTLKVQLYRWRKREREAIESVLRFALAYRSGGSAFDRLPETLRQAMLDNARAVLAETEAGTGEYLSAGQLGSIRCPVTCLEGTLSPRFYSAASLRLAKDLPHTRLQTVAGAGICCFSTNPALLYRRSAALPPGLLILRKYDALFLARWCFGALLAKMLEPLQCKQPIPTDREQVPGRLGMCLMTREHRTGYALDK